jgi:site-specific DNA-methyltransferase (adenine-specific)
MAITNEDNMELMKRYEDNHFDLAIVDPPYGIGMANGHKGSKKRGDKDRHKSFHGNDSNIPSKKYFEELKRVSKNQIIWGGNYMSEYLKSTQSWIVWDKVQPIDFSMAMGELAWTSFNTPLKIFQKTAKGGFLTNNTIDHRIHPTQKPVRLYEWLLDNYAKEGDKILDTHLGSGSIAIACHNRKFDLTACELDTEYYTKAMERIEQHKKQLTLF